MKKCFTSSSSCANRLNVWSFYQRPFVLGYSISSKALSRASVVEAPVSAIPVNTSVPRLSFWQRFFQWIKTIICKIFKH